MQKRLIHLMPRIMVIAFAAAACADDPASLARPEATPQLTTVDATDVSAGTTFTCAIRAGIVQCQGTNNDGQAPASKSAAAGFFTQVSAGGAHACALRNDGVAECWGKNHVSQAPPVRSATSGYYTMLTSGTNHNCALRNDGVIECWGENTHGQALATFTATTGSFTHVSAETEHTCARRSPDNGVQCWGNNSQGQAPTTKFATASAFQQVAVGFDHTCALRADGKIECWGSNTFGQAPALKTAGVGSFTKVAAADMYTCGLRTDGKIECWGNNSGFGEAPTLLSPKSGAAFSTLSVGMHHGCGTWNTGVLQCWGRIDSGESTSDIPAVLAFVGAAPFQGKILLYYADATDEAEFHVERRQRYAPSVFGEWQRLPDVGANVISFVDYLVVEGYYYQYRVRACDEWNTCTPWRGTTVTRAAASSAPPALDSATATLANPSQIVVAWNNTALESSYTVQRRVRTYAGYDLWRVVATMPADVATYTDPNVMTGRAYTYRVQACNGGGCTAWVTTNQIINETVPAAPSGLTANAVSGTLVHVSWTDNSTNEAAFQLQAKSSIGGESSDYFNVTYTAPNISSHDDSSVSSGMTYRYRVRSCNVAGCSAYVTSPQVTP